MCVVLVELWRALFVKAVSQWTLVGRDARCECLEQHIRSCLGMETFSCVARFPLDPVLLVSEKTRNFSNGSQFPLLDHNPSTTTTMNVSPAW